MAASSLHAPSLKCKTPSAPTAMAAGVVAPCEKARTSLCRALRRDVALALLLARKTSLSPNLPHPSPSVWPTPTARSCARAEAAAAAAPALGVARGAAPAAFAWPAHVARRSAKLLAEFVQWPPPLPSPSSAGPR